MTRHLPTNAATDAVIFIPVDRGRRCKRADRVLRACRWLWSRGIYPSPAALSLRLRGRSTRTLNGFETRLRNTFLEAKGIPHPRSYAYYRRFAK